MPLLTIPSGNVASATASTGYEVANSLRFNDDDSAYIYRDLGTSTAGSGSKFTFSVWVKRSTISNADQFILSCGVASSNHLVDLFFQSDDTLKFRLIYNNTLYGNLTTNAKYRDVSAWMHIVINMDTTQSTASNRTKMYVNGSQVTDFSASTRPNQSSTFTVNNHTVNNQRISFGRNEDGTTGYFDGYMTEVAWIDGTAYAASNFGEYDEDSPQIWKPKDFKDDVTFGTHGVYLDFEDSGDLDDDESGNGNDFTATNLAATDQATDTCTNNFCTMNPLVPTTNITFSEGNCKMVTSSSDTHGAGIGTFGLTAGKWYWEVKIASLVANHNHGVISELTSELYQNATGLQNDTGVTCWRNDDGGEMVVDGTATSNDYGLFTDGQIMGIALDMDNYNISIYRNGSALVSDFNMSTTRGTIFPMINTGISTTSEVNFGGCPAFTISSSNSDANGYGSFEHSVPSGYLSLCSKNLGSSGG